MLFNYKAIDQNGENKDGLVEAVNVDVAIASVQKRGLIISSIKGVNEGNIIEKLAVFQHVPVKAIVILTRQMATLFEAQVSALRVFKLLGSQVENKVLRKTMAAVSDDLQEGSSISKALAKHPKIYSDFYVNMVRAGEESGRLDQTFSFLADYIERQYEVTSKAKHALIYPAFVILTFIGVMALMFTVVIPKIAPILNESGQELPIYTRAVLWVSQFTLDYGLIFLVVIAVVAFLFARYIHNTAGRTSFDEFKLSIPYIGNLYKKLFLSRIADNMNTMISSGISMVRALETTAGVVGNEVYKSALYDALNQVKNGRALSAALAEHDIIPSIMVQMMKVGEETGELGNILKTLAKFYQKEVVAAVDTLIDMIEPAMIVLLGLGVGTLLASILMPIYNLAQSF